jgi:RNA polymerase sigma factor (sigma-70 family)
MDRSDMSPLRLSKRTPDAFTEVYRAHARPILLHLTRRTYDPDLALDLTAETFAQAFASRGRFRGTTPADEAAWLFGIANHVLSRTLRRGRAERRALHRLGLEPPDRTSDDLERIVELAGLPDLHAAVANGFGALTFDQREAIRLRVIDELPYPLIASRLNITEPTARARVSRGLRILVDALDSLQTRTEHLT